MKHENMNNSQKESDRNTHEFVGQKHEREKKSQKEDYEGKSKSSPSLLPLAREEEVLFQCKASSKPSDLSHPSSSKSNWVHPKPKNPYNTEASKNDIVRPDNDSHTFQLQKKNLMLGSNSKWISLPVKSKKQNLPHISQFMHPQFISIASQSQQPRFDPVFKCLGKFQHGYPQNFPNNETGTTAFGNSRFSLPQGNLEFPVNHQSIQSTRLNDKYQRDIHAQKTYVRNQLPVMYKDTDISQQNFEMLFVHNKEIKNNSYILNSNLKVPVTKETSTPLIKHIKKNLGMKSCSNPEKRTRRHLMKKNKKVCDFKMKMRESCNTNAVPLLSFHCGNATSEKNLDFIQFDDDDDEDDDKSVISDDSVSNVGDFRDFSEDSPALKLSTDYNLIDHSDDPYLSVSNLTENFSDETDSNASDETSESDITSEFTVTSSILSSESQSHLLITNRREEAFVSVFWDIENCSLPSWKSAVDFASYVRDSFYIRRTEVQFTAACDVSKLSSVIVRELDEAGITLIHISSINKNAADKKIQGLLQKFQLQYRMCNSAVVLISSDSDFSQFLLDMRYQHHIFVNLICKKHSRRSLTTAANKYVFFEDVTMNLPDRDPKNDLQHILVIKNLPNLNYRQIKSCLSEKLNSFNCRIIVNASGAKIVFKDRSVCERALDSLKGYYLGGNALHIAYQTEQIEIQPKKLKISEIGVLPPDKNINKSRISENVLREFLGAEVFNSNNVASLSICVNTYLGNVEYWKKIFESTWKTTEFSIQWEGSLLDGFFLVNFRSLKKAQKVKKILMKNQINDPDAPRFLKLVKNGKDIFSLDGSVMNSSEDLNKKIIDEYVLIIENKKLKLLRNHDSIVNKINQHGKPEIYEVSEAMTNKLREYREQKETFINFTNITINIVKSLHHSDNLDLNLKELFYEFTRECNCFSLALPIYAKKETILKGIQNHQVLIIRAETGSGKSTQLTQYVWRDKYVCRNGKIMCTQPRKIAAISLAKYVSSQIGCKLGDVVGYQVGMSSKVSVNTKIVYATDFTLLKLLISEDLNDISCIIIDEAHERTIYTDILIGMIKQYLPKYPHLKIVITSATIDTSIFQEYFSLTADSVLQISGRTFPIEDIWQDCDVTPDWDYFNKTIDIAFEILSEDPGDILSFLTTPLETEKAFQKFSQKLKGRKEENKVKVFYLHGKMNSQEQQKVFEKTRSEMRKVIFATNCAETSITIPGIKYVIDCGLVKESQYDAVQNMNILSVGFVSKSSSEQRRGRAGRTENGKCYHLFSKTNYENMVNNTDPEILRINLGQALMKLMKMGVRHPLQFDFLQSPPKQQLISAMNQLLYLKAVDENTSTLTELGKKMSALPFEPRLCHLIFHGFDYNIGYDCLVVAALITMSHTIFFRNSENKDEADKRKRRFCESESDFISYLEVYKEWADVPKNLKSQWCVVNCINARSMRTVHELVNEVVLILQKELHLKVNLKFNTEVSNDTLMKTIFFSFSQNLSVFSGHSKFGYKCLNTSNRLLIHPSSSLWSFGQSTPKFVVYDTILKTSQRFMVNVSPVTEKMIFDVVNLHNLPIDLRAITNLSGFEIVPYIFSPIGKKIIINSFIGKKGIKRRELEIKIKEFTHSDFVYIVMNVSDGCVTVFGFHNKHDEIHSVVLPIIKDAQQALRNEESNLNLFEDRPFTAILGAGGFIHDVVLPGEFTDVKVVLKEQGNIESVLEKLSTCGIISKIREWKKYFKVTFKTAASAQKALFTYYNEKEFSLQSIHENMPLEKDHLYKILMYFYRRPCVGVAYISVYPQIPPFLLPFSITYNDVVARVTLSKKTGDIRITDLPSNTDKKVLESVISSLLPSNIKITKCIIPKKKPYVSSEEEMKSIKRNIIGLFSEFTFKGNVEVYLGKPNARDFTWNATVFIKDYHAGETAVNVLKNRKDVPYFLGGFVLKPELKTYLYCKSKVFSVVKEEIEEALQFLKSNYPVGNKLNINAIPKWTDTIEIKIESNNISDITDAREFIRRILSGYKLNFPNTSNKEKLFTNFGRDFMKTLAGNHQDCLILQNDYNKMITIFGKKTTVNFIKLAINSFLFKLENDDCKDISLKTNSGKSIFKELLKKYGYDLQQLKEECNVSDIKFDKCKQILTVEGVSSSILKCESIIQDIKKNMETDGFEVNGETCPVCCDEISEDKHRLEYCGHPYCTECLLHLFQNSEDIPLNCEVCENPIVLADIFWALNERKPLQKVVFQKFLHSFVASRSDISFCPSPDCIMIFRVTEDSNIFKCPVCGNSICTQCEELYHYGMSCSLHKCTKSNSDYFLKAWFEEDPHNRKHCPSCNSPIEKNGGSDHITCWKCKCHMCWLCLKVFATGIEVCSHIPFCNGGNV